MHHPFVPISDILLHPRRKRRPILPLQVSQLEIVVLAVDLGREAVFDVDGVVLQAAAAVGAVRRADGDERLVGAVAAAPTRLLGLVGARREQARHHAGEERPERDARGHDDGAVHLDARPV